MNNPSQMSFTANNLVYEMEDILSQIAQRLDMPDSMFEKVTARYESLAQWVEREASQAHRFKPQIYVQGSFSLGTMIRPLTDLDEFDIDCVCSLSVSPSIITQKCLKECVGDEVCNYAIVNQFKKRAVEWDKCWTIEYADENYTFKIDIVPAIPDIKSCERLINEAKMHKDIASTAIFITDKNRWNYKIISDDWLSGNPKGYTEWFKDRMRAQFNKMKTAFVKNSTHKLDVEDVPDYKIKTPLQKSIQLLKRHRDSYFKDKGERPSSIILTTLAAKAYENEPSLVTSMNSIINKMEKHIEQREGIYWVENPVDPSENFADSWSTNSSKATASKNWLNQLKLDWHNLCLSDRHEQILLLKHLFGQKITKQAYTNLCKTKPTGVITNPILNSSSKFDVPQREKPSWLIKISKNISINGLYSHNKATSGWVDFQNDSSPLDKGLDLRFYATTDAEKPYTVYWQVVNTGKEAEDCGQLRGKIFKSKSVGAGGLQSTTVKEMHNEQTKYKGMHWVECFVIKSEICIARSNPFVVNIK